MQASYFKVDRFIGKYGKFYKALSNIACTFFPDKIKRQIVRHYLRYNESLWPSYRAAEEARNYNSFKYYLTLVACLKNEADYVAEWLEYYLLMGVEHFYIYNNNSDDNIEEVLKPHIDAGIVTYIVYPGVGKQLEIYNHALNTFRLESKWLIVVDLDEFVLSRSTKNIPDYLRQNEDYDQVLTQWVLFGDSGHKTKADGGNGLVIERFLHCDKKAWGETKAIVQPTKTYFINHHTSMVRKTKYADLNEIQCNHYFCKSLDEYQHKKAPRKEASGLDKYNKELFDLHNKNDVLDKSMLAYTEDIKKALTKRFSL